MHCCMCFLLNEQLCHTAASSAVALHPGTAGQPTCDCVLHEMEMFAQQTHMQRALCVHCLLVAVCTQQSHDVALVLLWQDTLAQQASPCPRNTMHFCSNLNYVVFCFVAT